MSIKNRKASLLFCLAIAGLGIAVPAAKAGSIAGAPPLTPPVSYTPNGAGADPEVDIQFSSVGGTENFSGELFLATNNNGNGAYTAYSANTATGTSYVDYYNSDGSLASQDQLSLVPQGSNIYTNVQIPEGNGSGGTSPAFLSPSGAFYYDDVVYPDNDIFDPNGSGVGFQLDLAGLLLVDQTTGAEVNIWGNDPTNQPYAYWTYKSGSYDQQQALIFSAVSKAAPVPVPASAGVGFSILGVFGLRAALRKWIVRPGRIA